MLTPATNINKLRRNDRVIILYKLRNNDREIPFMSSRLEVAVYEPRTATKLMTTLLNNKSVVSVRTTRFLDIKIGELE